MDARELSQELNLKAMNALQSIVTDEQRGLITRAQAMTGIRAIFDTVGGLVPTEAFEVISQAALEYRNATGYDVQLCRVGNHIEGYVRVCKSGAILKIPQAVPQRRPSYTIDEEYSAQSKVQMERLFNQLQDQSKW